ncbi:MAG: YraN family protein [Clostridia bacterium]|nr:YraN family protein [Clostridia bacterium]
MNPKQNLGKQGEEYAAQYLQTQGYQIIEKNFRCKQGEIDIIAKDKKEYVFVEVKTRTSLQYGMPREAVNSKKQKHIWNATKYYLYKNKLENKFIRFDVIEIYQKQEKVYINHIKQIM